MKINGLNRGVEFLKGRPLSSNINWFAKNQAATTAIEKQGFLALLATHIGGRP